ncbi:unnamed protein product [Nippostrongylus brasiliensis]|uniref:CCHC-type domain-containing protein n=1 Tax=Nippostrongylus brasiliensis TaxID=27835 RepID=A0A0N4Y7W3_NIPBR|nr:hypothetical protein Q1695_008286 [Nippostrongylus brasiliensis]VDL75863.1 unnamed protein product [Nippostrongylus brasiliensis]
MDQPQEVDDDTPLLMDINKIENVITDQLQALERMKSTLRELRAQRFMDEEKQKTAFETEMREAISSLNRTLQEIKSMCAERCNDQLPNREEIIIENNAMFMEGLEIDDQRAQNRADEPMEEETSESEESESEDEIPVEPEQQNRREVELEEDPHALHENERQAHPRQEQNVVAEARRRIEQEIQRVEQAIRNFDNIIAEIEDQPRCAPRRFGGRVDQNRERYMKCAFCNAIGNHYSDSCSNVRNINSRRQLIEEKELCLTCLEWNCPRGNRCRKATVLCFHCREQGHHSALCDLPEQSEEIRMRLNNARESKQNCLERLWDLNHELDLFPPAM